MTSTLGDGNTELSRMFKYLKMNVDNPTYENCVNPCDDVTDPCDDVPDQEGHDLFEQQLSQAEKQFEEFVKLENARKIDLYQLDVTRRVPNALRNKHKAGNKPVGSVVKLASLESIKILCFIFYHSLNLLPTMQVKRNKRHVV